VSLTSLREWKQRNAMLILHKQEPNYDLQKQAGTYRRHAQGASNKTAAAENTTGAELLLNTEIAQDLRQLQKPKAYCTFFSFFLLLLVLFFLPKFYLKRSFWASGVKRFVLAEFRTKNALLLVFWKKVLTHRWSCLCCPLLHVLFQNN
jgi:hypothetical protein